MKARVLFALALASEAVAAIRRDSPNPAPAAAPSAAPSPEMPGFSIRFEVANYNYDDLEQAAAYPAKPTPQPLTNSWKDRFPGHRLVPKVADKVRDEVANEFQNRFWGNTGDGIKRIVKAVAHTTEEVADATKETLHKNTDHVGDTMIAGSRNVRDGVKQLADAGHEVTKATIGTTQDGVKDATTAIHEQVTFLAKMSATSTIDGEALVGDVVRQTIHDTVEDLLEDGLNLELPAGPSPAPVAADSDSASFLEGASQAPQSSDFLAQTQKKKNVMESQVDIYVQFHPGTMRPLKLERRLQYKKDKDKAPEELAGRSTIVEVILTEKMGTTVDELPMLMAIVKHLERTGSLESHLEFALEKVTGLSPDIRGLTSSAEKIKQWSIDSCASHMKKVLHQFIIAYTRRMVPMAIFNECTNYMVELSFSHDAPATKLDRKQCRDATVKFAKAWNFGKGDQTGNVTSAAPLDFRTFCSDVCMAKHGTEAPQCHVEARLAMGH